VLSLVDPSEDHTESMRATEAYCRHLVTVSNQRYATGGTQKRLRQLGSMLSAKSYEWHLHREAKLDQALSGLVSRDRYDVVHFEFPHMVASRPRSADARGPAFLLDEHNIEYDVVRQTAIAADGAFRRAYSAINWPKVQTEERRAWAGLDGCTLTSSRDESLLLADAPGTRTAVVPNGVDLDFFQPSASSEQQAPTALLFFGAIDYYPNTDGVLFFTKDILPLLTARIPRVQLSIVGRRPPESVLALRSTTVEVTGAVEDVRPHITRAAVIIVPLRLGGGTRLKILEAMAMGKAIVSTSLGAEGLEVVPERDLLIADTPEAFASQIARLLDDSALAARLGAAARRLVAANYGWRASIDRLSCFYGQVIEARETP
jgi:glycosyltransferase involved in cell wall biosynthesis